MPGHDFDAAACEIRELDVREIDLREDLTYCDLGLTGK